MSTLASDGPSEVPTPEQSAPPSAAPMAEVPAQPAIDPSADRTADPGADLSVGDHESRLSDEPSPLEAAIVAVVNRAAAADGVKAIGDHILTRLSSLDGTVLLLGTDGRFFSPPVAETDIVGASDTDTSTSTGTGTGTDAQVGPAPLPELAGVAVIPAQDPAEFVLAPEYRGRAFGTRLLRETLEHTNAVWAHGNLPASEALVRKFGLKPARTLLQMRRPLGTPGDLGEAIWPTGVQLRTFVPGQDEDEFLAVNARAFVWHPEQGRMNRKDLAAEMAAPWFDPAGFFLAVDEAGKVLGFHWTKVHSAGADQPEPIGEVYVIGVDPESPVRRLGRPLTLAGLKYLAAQGLSAVMLYVEADNAAALRLYFGLGFTESRRDVVYRRG